VVGAELGDIEGYMVGGAEGLSVGV
jgi:hypothetical protein